MFLGVFSRDVVLLKRLAMVFTLLEPKLPRPQALFIIIVSSFDSSAVKVEDPLSISLMSNFTVLGFESSFDSAGSLILDFYCTWLI